MIFLLALVLLLFSSTAEAQKTCTPLAPGIQQCKTTATWPAAAGSTSFILRRSDGGAPKVEIMTLMTTSFQDTFTDVGSVNHCYDVIGASGSVRAPQPSPESCWMTPAIIISPPPPGTELGPYDVEIRLGSALKMGSPTRRRNDNSPYIYITGPKSMSVRYLDPISSSPIK